MISGDNKFIQEAIKQAKKSFIKGEVPVGSLIVRDGKIIARAHNMVESANDATAHAEILAIRKASKKLRNWRLVDTVLYSTVQPCRMCVQAIRQARIPEVVFGCRSPVQGNAGEIAGDTPTINPARAEGHRDECSRLMKDFFKGARKRKADITENRCRGGELKMGCGKKHGKKKKAKK
ncbi:MAG: nucleoside deaminase [Elusimicrobiota bacterium]